MSRCAVLPTTVKGLCVAYLLKIKDALNQQAREFLNSQ